MKKNGSNCEFQEARDRALLQAWREEMLSGADSKLDAISARICRQPCVRFWVSEERAAIVVSAMMKGEEVENMLPTKRRMYEEITRRVVKERERKPRQSLLSIVTDVVNSPAPEFYLSPRYVRDRLYSLIRVKCKA